MPADMTPLRSLVIAIDGPSGSGKSSVSREVARRLGLEYLDTGAMYRAVCWSCLQAGIDLDDADAVAARARQMRLRIGTDPAAPSVDVDGVDVDRGDPGQPDLRRGQQGGHQPRRCARSCGAGSARSSQAARRGPRAGCVAEGRDITTVVAPDADVRVLLTASEQARLARRALEVHGRDDEAALAATRDQVLRRDADDSSVAQFMQAADGVVLLDTSGLSYEQTVQAVLEAVVAEEQQAGAVPR